MTTKEFNLMVDLMVTVSEKCGEGELTKLLKKYQQSPDQPDKKEKDK